MDLRQKESYSAFMYRLANNVMFLWEPEVMFVFRISLCKKLIYLYMFFCFQLTQWISISGLKFYLHVGGDNLGSSDFDIHYRNVKVTLMFMTFERTMFYLSVECFQYCWLYDAGNYIRNLLCVHVLFCLYLFS